MFIPVAGALIAGASLAINAADNAFTGDNRVEAINKVRAEQVARAVEPARYNNNPQLVEQVAARRESNREFARTLV